MPTVKLKYNTAPNTPPDDVFKATPHQAKVKASDTISFQLDPAIPGHHLRITIETPRHFGATVVEHAPGQRNTEALHVAVNIPPTAFAALREGFRSAPATNRITHYKCELINAAGETVVSSGTGGEIVPDIS